MLSLERREITFILEVIAVCRCCNLKLKEIRDFEEEKATSSGYSSDCCL